MVRDDRGVTWKKGPHCFLREDGITKTVWKMQWKMPHAALVSDSIRPAQFSPISRGAPSRGTMLSPEPNAASGRGSRAAQSARSMDTGSGDGGPPDGDDASRRKVRFADDTGTQRRRSFVDADILHVSPAASVSWRVAVARTPAAPQVRRVHARGGNSTSGGGNARGDGAARESGYYGEDGVKPPIGSSKLKTPLIILLEKFLANTGRDYGEARYAGADGDQGELEDYQEDDWQ